MKIDNDLKKEAISAGIDTIRGNAVIALGNIADPAAISALEEAIHHPKPQIRAYSAWALGRIGTKRAKEILKRALEKEEKPKVIKEIKDAMGYKNDKGIGNRQRF
ncbi:MAG: HEAT repeat domain-containing protein [bacterium]